MWNSPDYPQWGNGIVFRWHHLSVYYVEDGAMKRVIIELDFDQEEVESTDVHEYLYALIADNSLQWCFEEEYEKES